MICQNEKGQNHQSKSKERDFESSQSGGEIDLGVRKEGQDNNIQIE